MNQQARLKAQNITVQYDDQIIIEDLSLSIANKQITVIIGANACGKSTLLKSMARLLKTVGGTVLLDGKNIHQQNTKQVAKSLGMLPQSSAVPQGILVYDLVSRGRTPHHNTFHRWNQQDENAVTEALKATDTLDLAEKSVDSLSGGQRQRVWIAMTLAQQTDIILLDEPTTFLDLPHQIDILKLIRQINTKQQNTIVVVLHDLNLACRYADFLIAMKDGQIIAQGKPKEIITEQNIDRIFAMPVLIMDDPVSKTPMVIPK